jgi:AcrR family transcriptional regulator
MTRTKTVSDEAVLEAARRVFLRDGIQAPVAAIAKELGLSNAALFFRTKTKEELLFRALRPPSPAALDMLSRRPAPGQDLRGDLLIILLSLCSFFADMAPSLFLLAAAGLYRRYNRESNPLKILRVTLTRWLRRAKAGGIYVKDPRTVSELLIGTLEARFTRAYVRGEKYSAAQNRAYLMGLLKQLLETQPIK